MKKDTKEGMNGALGVLVILSMFGVALGIIYLTDCYWNKSKFKAGDCVEEVYENEFKRTAYYHDILKVGKKRYLTNHKSSSGKYYINSGIHTEMKSSLNEYETVDKSLCVAKMYKWKGEE